MVIIQYHGINMQVLFWMITICINTWWSNTRQTMLLWSLKKNGLLVMVNVRVIKKSLVELDNSSIIYDMNCTKRPLLFYHSYEAGNSVWFNQNSIFIFFLYIYIVWWTSIKAIQSLSEASPICWSCETLLLYSSIILTFFFHYLQRN